MPTNPDAQKRNQLEDRKGKDETKLGVIKPKMCSSCVCVCVEMRKIFYFACILFGLVRQ